MCTVHKCNQWSMNNEAYITDYRLQTRIIILHACRSERHITERHPWIAISTCCAASTRASQPTMLADRSATPRDHGANVDAPSINRRISQGSDSDTPALPQNRIACATGVPRKMSSAGAPWKQKGVHVRIKTTAKMQCNSDSATTTRRILRHPPCPHPRVS